MALSFNDAYLSALYTGMFSKGTNRNDRWALRRNAAEYFHDAMMTVTDERRHEELAFVLGIVERIRLLDLQKAGLI